MRLLQQGGRPVLIEQLKAARRTLTRLRYLLKEGPEVEKNRALSIIWGPRGDENAAEPDDDFFGPSSEDQQTPARSNSRKRSGDPLSNPRQGKIKTMPLPVAQQIKLEASYLALHGRKLRPDRRLYQNRDRGPTNLVPLSGCGANCTGPVNLNNIDSFYHSALYLPVTACYELLLSGGLANGLPYDSTTMSQQHQSQGNEPRSC